jgi:type I restriction enzyme S subunit
MASEWREVRLGEVVSINPDSIGRDWPFSYIKYIDISSVGEGAIIDPPQIVSLDEAPSRAKRLVRAGDTVISTVRPGRRSMFFVKQPEPDWVVSTGFAVLRPRREYIEPRYLYACVFDKAFTEFLVNREKGAAYPAVLPEDIADAVIKLPPLPEQRAIAHILGTLDDKIELNRRMSETLEQMARAIFKAWFVDFEPVRAKMEGRWRRGESLPGLPAHLYDLFPDRLVDSELGEIPEGWEVKPISELAEIVGGSTPKSEQPEYWEGGTHHWVTPKDLSRLSVPVLLDTERKITDAGLAQISSGLLPKGTVLLSSRAPIGYLAIAEVPVAINQGFIAMKPRPGVSNLFLLRWAGAAYDDIVSYANGSTFLEISKASFKSIRIVVPTFQLMHAFDYLSRPMYLKVVEHERESRTLAALRDALLLRLIRGEVRVKNAEKLVLQPIPSRKKED